ncbi:CD209 antigen-like protein E [Clupea harengus]|uniref:CD209 antigen-like protein E n=1 Tax=Clupea harengus TaxID=7950 RepID=A0A6P8EYF5_CLUHA|nr:CD209 antigen-like protein E [Clupea harengus]
MSAAIGVLRRQNDNLTDLHLRELERRQALFSLNTNLSRELRESAENNTLLWAQSQELLEQSALRNSENLELRVAAERVRSQNKECERVMRNLTGAQENAQNFRREVAELRNSSQHLQGELTSLDFYCPVVNQTTQERRCRSCEDGWNHFRSKCYFFSRDSNSWAHGRTQCLSQGADLLVINSREEQRFVFGMSWRLHPEERAWVGMTDAETEGEWRWVDGSLVRDNVQYWVQRADGSSEPDDWRVSDEQGEDCGHIDTVETELSCWMDAPCHAHFRWICEKAL